MLDWIFDIGSGKMLKIINKDPDVGCNSLLGINKIGSVARNSQHKIARMKKFAAKKLESRLL